MQTSAFKRIALELKELITSPPEGIQVVEDDNISEVQASIAGPAGTPYEGGLFRMKLKLGADFPQAPPKGFFQTKIFHPNVSKSGEICVNTLKKDWKEELGIKHVLLTVKCLLIVPNPESALNEEAGRLLLENYEEYCKVAKMWTGIHAIPRKDSLSLSKSGSTIKIEKEGDGADAPAEGDSCTKENSDPTNEGVTASLESSTKKTPVAAVQKKAAAVLDKKRSLKRL